MSEAEMKKDSEIEITLEEFSKEKVSDLFHYRSSISLVYLPIV